MIGILKTAPVRVLNILIMKYLFIIVFSLIAFSAHAQYASMYVGKKGFNYSKSFKIDPDKMEVTKISLKEGKEISEKKALKNLLKDAKMLDKIKKQIEHNKKVRSLGSNEVYLIRKRHFKNEK